MPNSNKFSGLGTTTKPKMPTAALASLSSARKAHNHIVVPTATIAEDPTQPRREFDEEALQFLAEDIKARGILQPLLVRPGDGGGGGDEQTDYTLIAGARRLKAAKLAGLIEVPVVVMPSELGAEQILIIQLVENLQREGLRPEDEKAAFQRLMDEFNLSEGQIARLINKSVMYVSRRMNNQLAGMATPESELPVPLDQTNGDGSGGEDSAVNHNNNGALSPAEQQAVNVRINRFNPAVFRKFNQAIETARVWVKQASPDMVNNIRRDVEEIKRNLAELEALLVEDVPDDESDRL